MMKAHSFVRENVPRVLAWCKEKNGTFRIQPGFHLHLLSDSVLTFPLMAYFFLIVCVHIFSLSSAGPGPVVPQVSQYLYFLFAPTLIYRDKYPRYCFVLSHGAYIEHFYVLFCFTVEL